MPGKQIKTLAKEAHQFIDELEKYKPKSWISVARGIVDAYEQLGEREPMQRVHRKYQNILHAPDQVEDSPMEEIKKQQKKKQKKDEKPTK